MAMPNIPASTRNRPQPRVNMTMPNLPAPTDHASYYPLAQFRVNAATPNPLAPAIDASPFRVLHLAIMPDTSKDTAYNRDMDLVQSIPYSSSGNQEAEVVGEGTAGPHGIASYGFSPIVFTSGAPRPLPFVNKVIDPVALRATSKEIATLDKLIADAQRTHSALDTFVNALKAEEKRGAFTFTKLPGELRNRIYRYALANEITSSINLRYFKLPALAQTSVQLREESIPLFFSECAFHVEVESNFQDRKSTRTKTPQIYANPANFGRLRLPASRRAWLREMGQQALFKNITIYAVASMAPAWGPLNHRTTSRLRIKVAPQGNLEMVVQDGLDHPSARRGAYLDHDKEDVDAALAEMRKKAEEIAASKTGKDVGKGRKVKKAKGKNAADGEVKGFRGLDWQEIERIAQQLRFKMPEPTSSDASP